MRIQDLSDEELQREHLNVIFTGTGTKDVSDELSAYFKAIHQEYCRRFHVKRESDDELKERGIIV